MSNVTSIRKNSSEERKSDCVSTFLSHSLRRPLTLQVDTAKLCQLASISEDPINQLAHELVLWHETLGSREIACVELRYRQEELAPYDVTRLMHCIASEFKLKDSQCRVIFPSSNIEQSSFALLKGLGFSNALFEVQNCESDSLRTLSRSISDLRNLQFETVGLQIKQSTSVEELTQIIRYLQESLEPDYVFIGCSTNKLLCSQNEISEHREKYRNDSTHCCPTIFEDDVYQSYSDHIQLGPNSTSEIQGRCFNTLANAEKYQVSISHQQLPLIQIDSQSNRLNEE